MNKNDMEYTHKIKLNREKGNVSIDEKEFSIREAVEEFRLRFLLTLEGMDKGKYLPAIELVIREVEP